MWIVGLLSVPGAVSAQPVTTDNEPGVGRFPATIPIFPLPDGTLFPNVTTPRHIFEARYRTMINDALRGNRIIGIVLLKPGYEADYQGRPPINPIGCAGFISDVQRTPDGRFYILLTGMMKFRVTGEDASRPYRLAHVVAIPEELSNDEERAALHGLRERLEALLATFFDLAGSRPRFMAETGDEIVVNTLAQELPLTQGERQALLEQEGVIARARALIDLLELKALLPR